MSAALDPASSAGRRSKIAIELLNLYTGRRGWGVPSGIWILLVAPKPFVTNDLPQIMINNIAFMAETMYSIVYVLGNKYARLF